MLKQTGIQYEQVKDWPILPPGCTLGQTAVATDSHDNVYLYNTGAHPLVVLDDAGRVVRSWDGDAGDAHGVLIDGADNLYLPIRASSVIEKCTPEGETLMTLGCRD